jgi:hypothetical protein
MLTVTAEITVSSSPEETWGALGRRAAYLCFPGVTSRANGRGPVNHLLDLPIVDRQEQSANLSVVRAGRNGRRERRFRLRSSLVRIAGRWRIEPDGDGVRLSVTLDYEIAPSLKGQAMNVLRSGSPLPIRTDADAIMSRAVDEFFETRFAEHAAAFCNALRAHLESGRQGEPA